MIKFEEHDDNLFRMLEEPVPLTDDAELPVLVRLIQDDTMLGKANKRSYHPDTLAKKIICSSSKLTDDGLFMDGNYTYCYEIIGIPVVEGSRWWALWAMMEGKKVNYKGVIGNVYWALNQDGNVQYYDMDNLAYIGKIRSKLEFGKKDVDKTGWQIYKEPEPQYKVGDWVEWHEGLGTTYQSQITRISHSAVYSKGICIPLNIITRKLKPSEVVIHIGCMSGTVKDLSYVEDGIFWFIGKKTERCPGVMHAILYGEMLDTETRELVEGLLKAQDEEK